MVKLLKRQTKQLQQQQTEVNNSEDPCEQQQPPWESRKLLTRIGQLETTLQEKNGHIEQLLADCRKLEEDAANSAGQVGHLAGQLDQSVRQLQLATHNYETLQQTYRGDFYFNCFLFEIFQVFFYKNFFFYLPIIF